MPDRLSAICYALFALTLLVMFLFWFPSMIGARQNGTSQPRSVHIAEATSFALKVLQALLIVIAAITTGHTKQWLCAAYLIADTVNEVSVSSA